MGPARGHESPRRRDGAAGHGNRTRADDVDPLHDLLALLEGRRQRLHLQVRLTREDAGLRGAPHRLKTEEETIRGREGAATLQNDAASGHEKRLEVHVAVRVGDFADVDVQRGVHGLLVEARALSN